jgi:hypothetical protein
LQSLFFYEARKNSKYVFELMVNVLMLHDYWIFCVYKLLLSQS